MNVYYNILCYLYNGGRVLKLEWLLTPTSGAFFLLQSALKRRRQTTFKMAAARRLMKRCTKTKPSGGFRLESLSRCSTAANTSPRKMSSFCQVKDGEDVLQISTVGKWPVVSRGGSLPSGDTSMLFNVSTEQFSRVEVASASAAIFSCLGF